MPKVAIIGGGAAGMACAIAAAREGAEAHVYERADRVGKKLLVTGNGRCNMSNTDIMSSDYNDPEFVQEAMNVLPPESVMAFFEDLGVLAFEEDEGRIYPYSNKAATVLDMLRLGMKEAGVVEHCDREVRAVAPLSRGGWAVAFADDAVEGFDAVVCAVGGNPSRALLPSDIAFHACTPVLAALKTDTTNIKALSGIRVRARVYLDEDPEDLRDAWLDVVDPEFEASYQGPEERGEVLFRDWGISGIAVFDMSRYVEPGQMVFLDLLPDMEPQDKVDFIWEQSMAHPSRTAAEVMSGLLPSRVARAVVVAGGLNPDEPIIAEQEAVVLAMVSESFGLSVRGIADPKQAQVTRGGFATECFDAHTFECREHAGLFACGEALDVDGRCGGYNLHWAWTSGLLAGASAAHVEDVPEGSFEGLSLGSVEGLAQRARRSTLSGHEGGRDQRSGGQRSCGKGGFRVAGKRGDGARGGEQGRDGASRGQASGRGADARDQRGKGQNSGQRGKGGQRSNTGATRSNGGNNGGKGPNGRPKLNLGR